MSLTKDALKTPNQTSETDRAFASFDGSNDTTKYSKSQIAPLPSNNNMQQKKKLYFFIK